MGFCFGGHVTYRAACELPIAAAATSSSMSSPREARLVYPGSILALAGTGRGEGTRL